MRCFFSVVPDAASRLQIESWRRRCWPTLERPVAAQNFHLTLAFVGDIDQGQLQVLEEVMDACPVPQFNLTLNDVGYWSDSSVLWLAPVQPPEALMTLARRCASAANKAGVRVSRRRYQPHLTLARRVTLPPAPPLMEADFQFQVSGFLLQQSILDKQGARYIDVCGWGEV